MATRMRHKMCVVHITERQLLLLAHMKRQMVFSTYHTTPSYKQKNIGMTRERTTRGTTYNAKRG